MRRAVVGLVVVGVVVGVGPVSACSGGGASSATGISKRTFVREADAICAATTVQLKALGSAPTDPVLASAYLSKSAAIFTSALNQLQSLDGPPADRAILQDHLISFSVAQIASIQGYVAQINASAGNTAAAQAVVAKMVNDPVLSADHSADDTALGNAGFSDCSKLGT